MRRFTHLFAGLFAMFVMAALVMTTTPVNAAATNTQTVIAVNNAHDSPVLSQNFLQHSVDIAWSNAATGSGGAFIASADASGVVQLNEKGLIALNTANKNADTDSGTKILADSTSATAITDSVSVLTNYPNPFNDVALAAQIAPFDDSGGTATLATNTATTIEQTDDNSLAYNNRASPNSNVTNNGLAATFDSGGGGHNLICPDAGATGNLAA